VTSSTGRGVAEPPLAADFPDATATQWRELVAALSSRRGGTLDPDQAIAKLTSSTYDGFAIAPLYDAAAGRADVPLFPARDAGWQIRQRVAPDWGGSAVEELQKGAGAVALDLRRAESIDASVVAGGLRGVLLDLASVEVIAGPRWAAAATALIDVLAPAGDDARGVLGCDPLGQQLVTGAAADLDALSTIAARVAGRPGIRAIAVDAARVHDAGASEAQELAAGVALVAAYVRILTAAGLTAAQALGTIELQLAASADQFATVAKLRAARRLLARVAEAFGASGQPVAIHATTSLAMMTAYDPWVNLLRTTVACFAAGVGGADSVTVLPYDLLSAATPSELGRRMARNTQTILALEANIGRVGDPAAGSWYVSGFGDELAKTAWKLVREIEAAGGMAAPAAQDLIAAAVTATWNARVQRIDTRRDPITGVSEFPDIGEPSPVDRPVEPTGDRLPVHRYAERFEDLRRRVEHTGERPLVFLAAIGSPSATTARVTFAKNFFEVAGLRTVQGPETSDPSAIATAFRESGATVACICSSDAVYAELAAPVAAALREAGSQRTCLAGRPRDVLDALRAAGVDEFVAIGTDVHRSLADLLELLRIP
jgi:methylmalonyl-CoA mutase